MMGLPSPCYDRAVQPTGYGGAVQPMFMGLFHPNSPALVLVVQPTKAVFFPWSWLWYPTAALVCTPNFLLVLCFLLHTGALLQLVCFLLASHLLLAHHFLLAHHLLPGLEEAPELGCSHVGQVSTLQPTALGWLSAHLSHSSPSFSLAGFLPWHKGSVCF